MKLIKQTCIVDPNNTHVMKIDERLLAEPFYDKKWLRLCRCEPGTYSSNTTEDPIDTIKLMHEGNV